MHFTFVAVFKSLPCNEQQKQTNIHAIGMQLIETTFDWFKSDHCANVVYIK